jgi:hypothetical protein
MNSTILQGGEDQEGDDIAFNPQYNGVVERKNQTIVEATRVMFHDHDLPMFLWEETCNNIVYVQNISPHRILEDKTLEEEFTGARPEIGNLRIFSCQVYIHVPKEKRMKLEPSRRKGVFWDTMRLRGPTRYTIHDSDTLRLVGMSGLRRSWIPGGPERP